MFIVNHRKVFYTFSGILVLASLSAIFLWGLRPGIDFTGGSLLEVTYASSSPVTTDIQNVVSSVGATDVSVRPSGDNDFIIRSSQISNTQEVLAIAGLSFGGKYVVSEKEFDSVGPTLGAEALQKSWISIVLVLAAIILFITFAFRKVSKPVSSWKYGIIAVISLVHNILIPLGLFALLGHLMGIEVDTLFITALLVIIGFSVHDNIVVFDRVRENLRRNDEFKEKKDFDVIVGESINQTFVRSINTSLTMLFAILVLYLIGPAATQNFALALLVGITAGTYSSIFIGSPLLVTVYKRRLKKLAK